MIFSCLLEIFLTKFHFTILQKFLPQNSTILSHTSIIIIKTFIYSIIFWKEKWWNGGWHSNLIWTKEEKKKLFSWQLFDFWSFVGVFSRNFWESSWSFAIISFLENQGVSIIIRLNKHYISIYTNKPQVLGLVIYHIPIITAKDKQVKFSVTWLNIILWFINFC